MKVDQRISQKSLTSSDIAKAVQELGLAKKPLEVHSSLRSFGKVEGGADAVIDGFSSAGCTLLVPTFSTFRYAMAQPSDGITFSFERNASAELSRRPYIEPTPIFEPSSNDMNDNMGVIPKAVLNRVGRVRGSHEMNSFTAIGPLAYELMSRQTSNNVYGHLEGLIEAGGLAVLIGVGLDSLTLLHLAERVAGRNEFRRWVSDADGKPKVVTIGSCSRGFENFAPVLQDIERQERVGESVWRIFDAREAVERAAEAIERNPEITRCAHADCVRCPDAIAGGPILK